MTDIDDLGHPVEPERVKVPARHTGKNSTVQMVTPEGEVTIMEQGEPTEWIKAEVDSHVGVKDSEHLDKRLEVLV